jgi:hypothetical protein
MDVKYQSVEEWSEIAYTIVLVTEAVGILMNPYNDRHLFYILNMVNNLQLVGHTPMLKVSFPPNSKIAFE